MVSLTGNNAEACKIILTKGLCMFQFLGDPHLTISHVNYKLDQVKENRQKLKVFTCSHAFFCFKFQLLFPSVMMVVETIKSQKVII